MGTSTLIHSIIHTLLACVHAKTYAKYKQTHMQIENVFVRVHRHRHTSSGKLFHCDTDHTWTRAHINTLASTWTHTYMHTITLASTWTHTGIHAHYYIHKHKIMTAPDNPPPWSNRFLSRLIILNHFSFFLHIMPLQSRANHNHRPWIAYREPSTNIFSLISEITTPTLDINSQTKSWHCYTCTQSQTLPQKIFARQINHHHLVHVNLLLPLFLTKVIAISEPFST